MPRNRRLASFALGAAAVAAGAALASRRSHVADRESLRDRVVVITGGSRGLGFALAEDLARGGARVTIAGRDAATVDRARELLAAEGLNVDGVRCDVRDQAQAEALIAQVEARHGQVDVLVNDAGVIEVGSVWDQSLSDFRESVETHVFGPLHTMRAVLPSMRARGDGRIVNIASIGGLVGTPHLAPYSAGKFGLVGFVAGVCGGGRARRHHRDVRVPGLDAHGLAGPRDLQGPHQSGVRLVRDRRQQPAAVGVDAPRGGDDRARDRQAQDVRRRSRR